MQNLNGKQIVVTGGSQGLGLAMAEVLAASGAHVTAIARNRSKFTAAERVGAVVIAGDATDATLMNRIVSEQAPDVLILNAGARIGMKAIDKLSWEEFSAIWNNDVKAGLAGIQAALNTPMKPGGRILVMSSGAATVMSVPHVPPENLRLSEGYVGAKRMLWFMAHSANAVSRERGLGLHFQVLVPNQQIPGTALGHQVAAVHAALEGISIEEHVIKRYGSIFEPREFAEQVAELLADPRYSGGVAYGFHADTGITALDI
jgi:NAD(P)-dependent dehydrogenase (short-subunit alcohol dehydrogenase family)